MSNLPVFAMRTEMSGGEEEYEVQKLSYQPSEGWFFRRREAPAPKSIILDNAYGLSLLRAGLLKPGMEQQWIY